jgi:cytochrome P450
MNEDQRMNQHPTWNEEEQTRMLHQPTTGRRPDLQQHFCAAATGLRYRYPALQMSCPVRFDHETSSWLVLGFKEVDSLLTDTGTFASSRPGVSPSHAPLGSVAGIVRRQFLFLDGREHLAVQALLRKALGRQAGQLGPFLHETITGLLEQGRREGHLDLVGGFASPLSRRLIAHVLGVPASDPEMLVQLERWSDAFADVTSGHRHTDLGAVHSLYDFFGRLLTQKRRHPGDDLLSVYLATASQGLRDQEEVISDAMMLFAAGRATLRKLIPAVLWHLLHLEPEWLAHLCELLQVRPAILLSLTEEGLRWATPTSRVARWTTQDVALGRQVIPAGVKVFAQLSAANRDEHCFPDATRFEPDRRPNRHCTFGAGPHACTGAAIARKTAQAAFGAVLALPNLKLATPELPPPLYPNENIGGIQTCLVVLE